ncbi:MAG TPA: asparaginase [Candidatus Dormibacteraeota bacterium]|nr:asparaginase [Candidatus Dormibacteraeota bacterium]
MSPEPALLATAWRGDVPEAEYRGHVAVVDATGRVVDALGDPDAITTLRSCVKPLQALPFIRLAVDRLGAPEDEVAIACSSHSGEPEHVAVVQRLLSRAGLDEASLACGPQLPFDEHAAAARIRAGTGLQRIDNNCSGKHAAMLATCVAAGWPVLGYERRDHPMQRAVAEAMGELLGSDLSEAPYGIDGCGLPTYGLPLQTVARAFAAGQADHAFRRGLDAMAAHPHLVAGTGRFDTALLAAVGDRVASKIGGAAIWAGALRPDGPGIAVKLEAGADPAIPAVALAVLRRLGVQPDGLETMQRPVLRNWSGDEVGEIRIATILV